MLLKFQEMVKKEDSARWRAGAHYHVVECHGYSVDKVKRRVVSTGPDDAVLHEEVIPSDEHVTMYVQDSRGDTVDTVVFPAKNGPRPAGKFVKSVDELISSGESPLPLNVIPNQMGINLCSVESVSWERREDDQLVSVSVQFIPSDD